mgnify:CR=1 FL=1
MIDEIIFWFGLPDLFIYFGCIRFWFCFVFFQFFFVSFLNSLFDLIDDDDDNPRKP